MHKANFRQSTNFLAPENFKNPRVRAYEFFRGYVIGTSSQNGLTEINDLSTRTLIGNYSSNTSKPPFVYQTFRTFILTPSSTGI